MGQRTMDVRIEQTERAFRQSTELAMGNDILYGLIEAFTNADDSYDETAGPILVRFPRPTDPKSWTVEVLDRAHAFPESDVHPKLLKLGSRTSGHEKGERKRGNRGRGAKDLTHFGKVRWDVIHDGQYFWLELDRDGRGEIGASVPTDDSIRDRLGIPRNGVMVTITCDRSRFHRPRRDTIAEKLQLAVQLRDIMSNPKRTIRLQYGDDDPVALRYTNPSGLKEFPAVDVDVPGYQGKARIVVSEVPTPFQDDPSDPCRQGGLLITSGRAVHESTLYRFESSPYAGYFTGSVRWDTIDTLSRDVDDREERGDELDPANPAQIITMTRRGLNSQHPAAKALKAAVEGVLKPHFERKAAEVGGRAVESVDTRRRLSGLAKIIARYQAKKSDELELEIALKTGGDVQLTPDTPVLEVIPPHKLLEFGKEHTFSVRARADALPEGTTSAHVNLMLVADPEGCLSLPARSTTLAPDQRLEGRLSGTFAVVAGSIEGTAAVEVRLEGIADRLLDVEVVPPITVEPPEAPLTFEFERSTYTVGVGKRKKILLLAPTSAVVKHGTHVVLHNSDAGGVLMRRADLELEPSPDGDWFQATLDVEGRQHAARATVTAQCGKVPLRTQTVINVGRDQSGPQPPRIEIGQSQSYARGTWQEDEDNNVTITINAGHPAVRRYFGGAPDFPGQDSVQARLMIAEIVADLTVREILNKQFKTEKLSVEHLYAQRFKMLSELLPQCHESQLSDAEIIAGSVVVTSVRRNGRSNGGN